MTDGTHAVGQPVYERFFGEKGWAAGPGYLPRTIPTREICAFTSCRSTWTVRGPVFDLLQVVYEIAGAARYEAEFRLYHELPRIELTVKLDKTLEKRAEGMYAALPFGRPDAGWWLDKAGAFCETEDRLPGSCADYYNFQRGFAAVRPGGGVTVSALDVPLVMFGGLHLWEYNTDLKARGCAFSWLTNNKWETNFKSECAGCHESRYVIELGAGSAPRDCLAILEKNELEPVVLRK